MRRPRSSRSPRWIVVARAAGSVLVCGGVWFCGIVPARAEENQTQDVTVRKTKEGLHFQLPSDWPVETRNGITAPIPMEEYLAKKFSSLENRLQSIEQRFNGFDVRLRALEEQQKKQAQGLRSTEAP